MNLRKVVEQERLYHIAYWSRKINHAVLQGKIVLDRLNAKLEAELEIFRVVSGEYFLSSWIKNIVKELGDPYILMSEGILHQRVPYWNPTAHILNIQPLGLSQDLIYPGQKVMIPWGYTIGGKNSAVTGVAPQLQPLPLPEQEQEDHEYDLSPTSYLEWITFYDLRFSPCCRKQILWNENKVQCFCQRCGNKIYA